MRICLSHNSALAYWRQAASAGAVFAPTYHISKLVGNDPLSAENLACANLAKYDLEPSKENPAHILLSDHAQKRNLVNVTCHYTNTPLKPGSILEVDRHFDAVCPELCFLQMASRVSFIRLVQIGYELCGTYVLDNTATFDSNEKIEVVFRSTGYSITTPRKLLAYLHSCETRPYGKLATRAAKLILPKSASPRETALAMLLHLPCRYGGYGIRSIALNEEVELSKKASAVAGKRVCYPDVWLKGTKTVIEYDSAMYHNSDSAKRADTKRRNALRIDGYSVFEITTDQFSRLDIMDSIVYGMCRQNGIFLRPRCNGYDKKHQLLFEELRNTQNQKSLF